MQIQRFHLIWHACEYVNMWAGPQLFKTLAVQQKAIFCT